MKDSQLSELLRDLPRDQASPEFTDRVLERLDHGFGARPRPWIWMVAASVVCVLALSFFGLREWRYQHEKQETLAELEQLRAEHRALEQELERVLRLRQEPPVIQLGGNEDFELLLDVESLGRRGQHAENLAVRPASLTRL